MKCRSLRLRSTSPVSNRIFRVEKTHPKKNRNECRGNPGFLGHTVGFLGDGNEGNKVTGASRLTNHSCIALKSSTDSMGDPLGVSKILDPRKLT